MLYAHQYFIEQEIQGRLLVTPPFNSTPLALPRKNDENVELSFTHTFFHNEGDFPKYEITQAGQATLLPFRSVNSQNEKDKIYHRFNSFIRTCFTLNHPVRPCNSSPLSPIF